VCAYYSPGTLEESKRSVRIVYEWKQTSPRALSLFSETADRGRLTAAVVSAIGRRSSAVGCLSSFDNSSPNGILSINRRSLAGIPHDEARSGARWAPGRRTTYYKGPSVARGMGLVCWRWYQVRVTCRMSAARSQVALHNSVERPIGTL